MINLQGGGYLDGAAHAREARGAAAAGQCAGWCTAALANHPPRGIEPNVEAIAVDWGGDENNHLHLTGAVPGAEKEKEKEKSASAPSAYSTQRVAQKLVNPPTSTTWYVDGGTGERVIVPPTVPTKGLVFLASRQIEPGSEIYFNYRLSPTDYPEWYAHVPESVMWRVVDEAEDGAATAGGTAAVREEEDEEEERRWEKRRRRVDHRDQDGNWGPPIGS